jgi:hypothetical protein
MFKLSATQRYSRAVLALWGLATALVFAGDLCADDRLRAVDHPAPWQDALVKLTIPVKRWHAGEQRHFIEDCTGTQIAGRRGTVILTAWHCVDGFTDLTKVITATTRQGRVLEARVFASGASMASDWEILQIIDDDRPSAQKIQLKLAKTSSIMGANILMAGYSGDPKLGDSGTALTYDPNCQIGKMSEFAGAIPTNCTAFKGASGGPTLILENGEYKVLGVISAGDEEGLSLFAPITPAARASM